MPRRAGGDARDLAEHIGGENWATLEDVIREVFARVGPRVLQWRVAWGVEPLVGLVVMHTAIVTARQMRLGELAQELKAAEATASELADARKTLARVEGVLAQFRNLADGSGSNRVYFPHDMAYAASVLDKALRGDAA